MKKKDSGGERGREEKEEKEMCKGKKEGGNLLFSLLPVSLNPLQLPHLPCLILLLLGTKTCAASETKVICVKETMDNRYMLRTTDCNSYLVFIIRVHNFFN